MTDTLADLPADRSWTRNTGGGPALITVTPEPRVKLVTPSQLTDAALRHTRRAVVVGTFDILQPGNLLTLIVAANHASHVSVVLAPDEPAVPAVAPRNALCDRAEALTYLRPVSAVTAISPARSREFLQGLKPFTWVTGPESRCPDALTACAAQEAADRIDVPAVPGCSTRQILERLSDGPFPLSVVWPQGIAEAAASPDPGPPGAGARRITVNGCFDILHVGHLRFLAQARAMGTELVVLINDDASVRRYKGSTRPVFPSSFRAAALRSLESVSAVHVFPEDKPLELIRRLRPAIHVKGGSYEPDRVREEDQLLSSWGGCVAFCPMEGAYSTTAYIRRAVGLEP